jgi:hypothetical protein
VIVSGTEVELSPAAQYEARVKEDVKLTDHETDV